MNYHIAIEGDETTVEDISKMLCMPKAQVEEHIKNGVDKTIKIGFIDGIKVRKKKRSDAGVARKRSNLPPELKKFYYTEDGVTISDKMFLHEIADCIGTTSYRLSDKFKGRSGFYYKNTMVFKGKFKEALEDLVFYGMIDDRYYFGSLPEIAKNMGIFAPNQTLSAFFERNDLYNFECKKIYRNTK